jgi:hypothetical protein
VLAVGAVLALLIPGRSAAEATDHTRADAALETAEAPA